MSSSKIFKVRSARGRCRAKKPSAREQRHAVSHTDTRMNLDDILGDDEVGGDGEFT
jgi:hypothetical protein